MRVHLLLGDRMERYYRIKVRADRVMHRRSGFLTPASQPHNALLLSFNCEKSSNLEAGRGTASRGPKPCFPQITAIHSSCFTTV